MIDDFFKLPVHLQDAVLVMTEKVNSRVSVLDQWQDDHVECILVRADTWAMGVVRFIIFHVDHQTAAAFRFPDSDSARMIMRRYLMSRREK